MEILNRVLQGWVRMDEAVPLLGVSERQAWRLLAAYRKEGAATLDNNTGNAEAMRDLPETLVVDKGPEFARKALDGWAYARGVGVLFIDPGRYRAPVFKPVLRNLRPFPWGPTPCPPSASGTTSPSMTWP